MGAHGGFGLKVDDAPCCIRQDLRERFGGDVEGELPGDRVEREPAEPVAVHDHEVGPVGAAGLVQEHDVRQGNIAELFGEEAPDEGHVRRESGTDVVRLQERYLPDARSAGAGAPDKGYVTLVAPVEDFFYGRFADHVKNNWLLQTLRKPMIGGRPGCCRYQGPGTTGRTGRQHKVYSFECEH